MTSLHTVSVVMMAVAARWAASRSGRGGPATSTGIPVSTGAIGKRDPDEPGLADEDLAGAHPEALGHQRAHALRARPARTRPWRRWRSRSTARPRRPDPTVAARWARLTCTGAAAARLAVKTPAAGTGPAVDATRARSGAPDALIPHASPDGHETLGRGDTHGYTPTSESPGHLGQAEGDIGALHAPDPRRP